MNDSIPINPNVGLNPVLTVCPLCGEQNGEIALAGQSFVWKHRCGDKTVAYRGQGPLTYSGRTMHCAKCGVAEDGRSWTNIGEYDPKHHGTLAGSPCQRCANWLKTGCILRCHGCRHLLQHEGVYVAAKEHDPAAYGENHEEGVKLGLLNKLVGRVLDVPKCPHCTKPAHD